MSNEKFEEMRGLRDAAEVVKTARVLAARRGRPVDQDAHVYRAAATRLADAGIDPADPDAPPHPFRFRNLGIYPVMSKAEATKHLERIASRRPLSPR
jgi:hypothetical protein